MSLIVMKRQEEQFIVIDEITPTTNGMIVCVYNKAVTLLKPTQQFSTKSYGFTDFDSNKDSWHTRTDGDRSQILARIKKESKSNEELYYYFATLKDFAEAVIKNDWHM